LVRTARTFTGKVRDLWLKFNSLGIYEGLSIGVIIAVVVICVVKKSFFISGSVLGASVIAYIFAFFLASYGLKRQGLGFERIFYAVASAACARWFFEIIYHYAFPGALRDIPRNLAYLSTNISEKDFPLIWSIVMVMIIFTGYRYMAVNKRFWVTLVLSAIFLLFWISIGYPQWVHPEKWPEWRPLIPLIPEEYTHATNEVARSTISNISLVINSITKITVCSLLPALFLKRAKLE
jgi:hypothetical protein